MARPYTVQLKGGGSITVNASDPAAAMQNAGPNADSSQAVSAGGHQGNTPTGHNEYSGTDTPQSLNPQGGTNPYHGAFDPNAQVAGHGPAAADANTNIAGSQPVSAGGPTAGTPFAAAATPTSATPTTASGNTNIAGSQQAATNTAATPTEYQYGMRPGESFSDWAARSFKQGTADFGPASMNPYQDQNPAALNPYQQWFQSRYGTSAGMNDLVAKTLGGGDFASGGVGLRSDYQNMMGNNSFGPTTSAGAASNLKGIAGMVDQPHTGSDLGRVAMLDAMQKDPNLANQFVLSQESNIGGPLMGYLAQRLNSMSAEYGNKGTPEAMGSGTSYWDMISKLLNTPQQAGNA